MHPELTAPAFPARSRLIHLAPIGVGTARTESLTGYIARLAGAHRVGTGTLLHRELARHLGTGSTGDGESAATRASLSAAYLRSINGLDPVAAAWTRVLEALTRRVDLRFLSMLTWAEVLPTRRLFRAARAWCPQCYDGDAIVHEHLLWNLDPVTVCPHHHRPLETRCPHCREALPILSWRSVPGFCSSCAGWLGAGASGDTPDRSDAPPEGMDRDHRIAADLGELLAIAPRLDRPPIPQRIPWAFATLTGCGDTRTLARRLGVDYMAAWVWSTGRMRPLVHRLLPICERLGVTLTDLLTAPSLASSRPVPTPVIPVSRTPGPRRPSRREQAATMEKARALMQAVADSAATPPPSMREVCVRVGHDRPVLYRHFPDLCRVISARWKAWDRGRGAARRERLAREVREVATRLHGAGTDPSSLNVARLMSRPGAIRDRAARSALLEVREGFGLGGIRAGGTRLPGTTNGT